MRVVSAEPVVVYAGPLTNWIFVRVTTDVDGLVGWGEATLHGHTRAVTGAIEDLASLLTGRDPLRIEHVFQLLYTHRYYKGGAVLMSAIGGIEMALWDIKGKHLGVPLYDLLGGRIRDRLPMYGHVGKGASDALFDVDYTPEEYAEKVAEVVAEGFSAVKLVIVPPARALDSRAVVSGAVERMAAVRERVGDAVDLPIDMRGRLSTAMAIQFARALEDLRPYWIEEPVQPGDPAAMAQVAQSTSLAVAAGERVFLLQQFRELSERRAATVLQPCVNVIGGLGQMRKVGAIAEAFGLSMAPHSAGGPVQTMFSVHFGFATSSVLCQEVRHGDVPYRDEIVIGGLEITEGSVLPPTRPGLGIDVDETVAARYPYRPETDRGPLHADGSLADL